MSTNDTDIEDNIIDTAASVENESKQSNQDNGDKSESAAAPASSLTQEERDEIAALPYEQARDRLIQAVQALEAGGLNLDQSMRQWEVGEALAKRAQSLLNDVRMKLDAAMEEQESSAQTAGTQSNLD